MKNNKKIIAGCVGLVLAAMPLGAWAAEPAVGANDPALAELASKLPGTLINDPRELVDIGNNMVGATAKVVKSKDIPGGNAARQFIVAAAADEPWKLTAGQKLLAPLARGDVVTVGFYARYLPMNGKNSGSVAIRIQQDAAPYGGFLDSRVDLTSEWKWHEVSGISTLALPKGAGGLNFQLAGQAQTVEIGQVIIVKGASSILGAAGASTASAAVPMPDSLKTVAGDLVSDPAGGPWGFYGAKSTQIADKNVFGGKATRVETTAEGGNIWDVSMGIPISAEIKEGDAFTVAIAVRTQSAKTADGKGVVGIRYQQNEAPYDGFADNRFSPGPNWQLIKVRSTATRDIAAGKAVFNLMFGGTVQVVDIGPVYVFKMKP
jgi:hypothetical protein